MPMPQWFLLYETLRLIPNGAWNHNSHNKHQPKPGSKWINQAPPTTATCLEISSYNRNNLGISIYFGSLDKDPNCVPFEHDTKIEPVEQKKIQEVCGKK